MVSLSDYSECPLVSTLDFHDYELFQDPWYHYFGVMALKTTQKPGIYGPNQRSKQAQLFNFIEQAIRLCIDTGLYHLAGGGSSSRYERLSLFCVLNPALKSRLCASYSRPTRRISSPRPDVRSFRRFTARFSSGPSALR